jgi:hypothetical protein
MLTNLQEFGDKLTDCQLPETPLKKKQRNLLQNKQGVEMYPPGIKF